MADKKPVWVDKQAHAILKAYARAQKISMVDVASKLVLERLTELTADAGLVSQNEKTDQTVPTAQARATSKRKATQGKNVRFLGGVWLV